MHRAAQSELPRAQEMLQPGSGLELFRVLGNGLVPSRGALGSDLRPQGLGGSVPGRRSGRHDGLCSRVKRVPA